MLNNLLSNAIKFTPDGGKVSVNVTTTENNAVIIRVLDTGIGMSHQDILKALEPFEQANKTLSRRYNGTGLGVHICVNFMKLFGGSLEIESKLNQGTIVTLIFPPERTIFVQEFQ